MVRVNLGRDTSGRPLIVDDRTLAKLRVAEKMLGFRFTIVQGSWRGGNGAAASAGTHDRGGVIDVRSWNLPKGVGITRVLTVLRRCGLIAWFRTKTQGFDPHIHAVDYGNPWLAASAARQVKAWEHGRNGLADNGPDDGPRVPVPKNPPTIEEDDMTPEQDKRLKHVEAVQRSQGKRVEVLFRAVLKGQGLTDDKVDLLLAHDDEAGAGERRR